MVRAPPGEPTGTQQDSHLDVRVLGPQVCVGQVGEVPQVQVEGLRLLLFWLREEAPEAVLGPAPLPGRGGGAEGLEQVLPLELLQSGLSISPGLVNGKWSAFILRFPNQWPLKVLGLPPTKGYTS